MWWHLGTQSGTQLFTGYFIAKSLSTDSVLVIMLRAIMIGPVAAIIGRFSWVLYVFGAFLVFTGFCRFLLAICYRHCA